MFVNNFKNEMLKSMVVDVETGRSVACDSQRVVPTWMIACMILLLKLRLALKFKISHKLLVMKLVS